MKKIYKSLGLFAVMLFSFYYTEKIAVIMQNKSPIMQNINEVEMKYIEIATNATVNGEYVVPGVMGRMVNKTKSFVNMKAFGVFNEYYLIFDDVKPDVSLEDHKDKIIKMGNQEKKSVAYLIEDGNDAIKKYLEDNKIPASLLITESTYKNTNYFEQINNDSEKYKNVESLLNKNNQNKNICYIKTLNKEFCKNLGKYLVEETFALGSTNIVEAKQKITSGAIIFVKKNATLENLKLLQKEINFKGLQVMYLSELIDEKK